MGIHNANSWKKRKQNHGNWRFTLEHIGREFRKFYPLADTPARLARSIQKSVGGRQRCAADMRCTRMGAVAWGSPSEYPTRHFTTRSDQGDGKRRGRHRHCSIAFVSAQGGDSAISLCRCICWCPTFVRQIATTRNAISPYARRGPDTKQTSDAIQAKISMRASSSAQLGRLAV
jgi:hypothetical protein